MPGTLSTPCLLLAAAFGLNMSVFLLIGKTSALTMNVAGVIKDWLLIGLSVMLFHAEVLPLQDTFCGVLRAPTLFCICVPACQSPH